MVKKRSSFDFATVILAVTITCTVILVGWLVKTNKQLDAVDVEIRSAGKALGDALPMLKKFEDVLVVSEVPVLSEKDLELTGIKNFILDKAKAQNLKVTMITDEPPKPNAKSLYNIYGYKIFIEGASASQMVRFIEGVQKGKPGLPKLTPIALNRVDFKRQNKLNFEVRFAILTKKKAAKKTRKRS